MQNMLLGKRILVTQATQFMGPAICSVFATSIFGIRMFTLI
jgi:hypothetical protein